MNICVIRFKTSAYSDGFFELAAALDFSNKIVLTTKSRIVMNAFYCIWKKLREPNRLINLKHNISKSPFLAELYTSTSMTKILQCF